MKKFFPILLCCLLLSACAKAEAPASTETPIPTEAPSPTATPIPSETPVSQQSITIYYGDDNAQMLLEKQVQVESLSAAVVVDELIRAGVLKEGVAVNSMSVDGSRLILDFNPAFGELLSSMGTSGEYIIVGSTVNSFLSAFDARTLIFTVDGDVLETGHMIYDYPLVFYE